MWDLMLVKIMNSQYWKRFLLVYDVVCWAGTISVIFYWIYLFSLNEDVTGLHYKTYYHDESSVFPMLSLCFRNPFNETKLKKMKPNINAESYLNFLEGKNYSTEMWEHDYEDIIFNISKHLSSYWIEWRNGSSKAYSLTTDYIPIFSLTFSGFSNNRFYSCHGMQAMNDVRIHKFFVLLENDIFPSKIRPVIYDFLVFLHYPNQLLRSTNTKRWSWPERKTDETYEMEFSVSGTEIVKSRYKSKQKCNEDWDKHDSIVLRKHSQNVGCRAPYQNQDIRRCSTRNEMKMSRFALRFDEYGTVPPCVAMEKISYSYIESELSDTIWKDRGKVWIGIQHQSERFKEIVQIR